MDYREWAREASSDAGIFLDFRGQPALCPPPDRFLTFPQTPADRCPFPLTKTPGCIYTDPTDRSVGKRILWRKSHAKTSSTPPSACSTRAAITPLRCGTLHGR